MTYFSYQSTALVDTLHMASMSMLDARLSILLGLNTSGENWRHYTLRMPPQLLWECLRDWKSTEPDRECGPEAKRQRRSWETHKGTLVRWEMERVEIEILLWESYVNISFGVEDYTTLEPDPEPGTNTGSSTWGLMIKALGTQRLSQPEEHQ